MVVVGGYPKNKEVERLIDGKWTQMDDYPFTDTYIVNYSFATVNNALFLFGKILIFATFGNKI